MTELSHEILALRDQGLSYNQIVEQLGCSKGTVAYHCGSGQKEKTAERLRASRATPEGKFGAKVNAFKNKTTSGAGRQHNCPSEKSLSQRVLDFQSKEKGAPHVFTKQDVKDKFDASDGTCYLSGRPIDLYDSSSYHLDHVVPRSKGGEIAIDNLEFSTPEANQSKHDMTLDKYLELCVDVLRHNGYVVTKQ